MSSSVLSSPAARSSRSALFWWALTFLWLCVQAVFSTDAFSAEHTGTILWKVVHAVYPAISASQFETLHFLIRKAAHFCTYGVLGVFAFFAWRVTWPLPQRWALRWSLLAVAVALTAGSLDEFHQSFVASRTSSPKDVLLDTVGAICFQAVLAIIFWMRARRDDRSRPTSL